MKRHSLRKEGNDQDSVKQGRDEEIKVTTLEMFEFVSCEGATSKAEKATTTTKLVDRVNKDDAGNEFVRCRLVARGFKPRREARETTYSQPCRHWRRNEE